MKKNTFLIIIILFNINYIYSAQIEEISREELELAKLNKELFLKSVSGDLEKVKELLQKGAQPDGFKTKRGDTALCAIADLTNTGTISSSEPRFSEQQLSEYQNIAKLLISYGANVNIKNIKGISILERAINNHSSIKLYDLLIKNGANINTQNKEGRTILMKLLDRSTDSNMIAQFRVNSLPQFVNIILFRANFEYNLDLLDNKGQSIYDYANKLPTESKNWVLSSLESYKLIKDTKIKHINECLNKEILPDISNVVQQYLGESGVISIEQKEKEEII